MRDVYKFTMDVFLRPDCNFTSSIIGELKAGDETEVSEVTNSWYHTQNGWAYGYYNGVTNIAQRVGPAGDILIDSSVKLSNNKDKDGGNIPNAAGIFKVSAIEGDNYQITDGSKVYWVKRSSLILEVTSTTDVSKEAVKPETVRDMINKQSESSVDTSDASTNSAFDGLRVRSLRGIFGMPYQYMPIADRRIDKGNDAFGRMYAEKIVSKIPLLVMVPGTPEFLAGYSKKEKENLLTYMTDLFAGDKTTKTEIDSLISGKGKYYGLKVSWDDYFMHVNPMCRTAATLLGIDSKMYHGSALGSYSWEKNANEKIHSMLNYRGGTAFYINSDNQISDSFGNSTGQSALAGKVNGISDMGREMNFLLGGSAATVGTNFDTFSQDNAINRSAGNTNALVDGMLSNGLIGGITNGINTVIAGGKLIFPEIWNDSHFSRDYNVSLKLVSPDCDDYSIYLNIIVPILHLVGFACPRSVGPNGYVSPFLVRAFYKGLFNCDMGIITNMSINKGQEASWTSSGLPTIVEVHFTIKELYGTMAITTNKNLSNALLSNVVLMDYIGNLCGININEPDLKRIGYFYYSQYFRDKFKDKVYTEIAGGLDNWATNKMLNLFKR